MSDPTPVRTGAPRATVVAVAVGALAAALFQFPADSNATVAGNDAIFYGLAVEGGHADEIVNGHHPLFHMLAWAVHALLVAIAGPFELSGVWAVRTVGAIGAAVGAGVLVHYAARAGGLGFALALVAAAAVTVGGRLFGSMGETYLPSYAIVLWLALATADAAIRGDRLPLGRLVVLTVLALGLRQEALLATPFVAGALATERAVATGRARRAIGYLAWSGVATVAVYGACWAVYRTGTDAPAGFVAWLTTLTGHGEWGRWGDLRPPRAIGLALTMTAASWDHGILWSVPGTAATAPAALPGLAAPPAWASWAVLFGPLALVLAIGIRWVGQRITWWCIAALLLPRFLFMAWWQPTNPEFHYANWIPIAVLALVAVSSFPRRGRRLCVGLVAAAFAVQAVVVGWRNQTLLFDALAERDLAQRVERVRTWAADGSPVFATDRWMHYALNRFGPVPHEAYYRATADGVRTVRRMIAGAPDGAIAVADTVLPAAFGRHVWHRPDQGPTWGLEHLLAIATGTEGEAAPFPVVSTPLDGTPPWAVRVTAAR